MRVILALVMELRPLRIIYTYKGHRQGDKFIAAITYRCVYSFMRSFTTSLAGHLQVVDGQSGTNAIFYISIVSVYS
jgi:hypothetical protein